jgi:TonB-dependent starch-binding outer membrane protein SusC
MKKSKTKCLVFLKRIEEAQFFKIMRVTVFILLLGMSNLFAGETYSQSTKFSFNMKDITLGQLFEEIQKQSEFNIFYKDNQVDLDQKVDVLADKASVEEILTQALKEAHLDFKVFERQIVIFPARIFYKDNIEIEKISAEQPQQKEITGKVTDADGLPLPGVSVIVKGTTIGTVTNADGEFSLNVPLNAEILQFSFVGMKTHEVPIENNSTFSIVLEEDILGIEEVIAIGYGVAKKSDITGAVNSIQGDELDQVSSQNALISLQGKAPGVNITSNSGAPGASVKVRVRGIGTINNSDPIYVVDGFITNNIDYLATNDIKSIEVLKDASATAIYGSRGANGVILITTNKSNRNQLMVNVDYNVGFQSANKTVDMLNAWQFATLYREAQVNSGVTLTPYEDKITQFVIDNKSVGTNWQNELLKENTPIYNLYTTISGGSDKNKFLFSTSYNDTKGIVKYNEYSRLILRLNNSYYFSENFIWNIDVNYSFSDNNTVNNNIFTSMLYMDPIAAAWDKNTNNYGTKTFNNIEASNPALTVDYSKNNGLVKSNRIIGSSDFHVSDFIVKELLFDMNLGYDRNTIDGKGFWPEYFVSTNNYNSESSLYQNQRINISYLLSGYFTYQKELGIHDIKAMLGSEYQKFENTWNSAQAFDIPNDPNQMYFDLAGNLERKNLEGNYIESSLLSYFSRINYSFRDRYFLTATVRADGSSKFIDKNRWGFFPSAAFAWNIKNENFLQDVNFISGLKLNAGWGIVGNQNSLNNPYAYASTISTESNSYIFNETIVNGYYPEDLANKEIKWESTETFNVGLDLLLWENRLNFQVNAYKNITRDMIATPSVPMYVGYGAVPANIGSMENKGLEFLFGYKQKVNDFSFGIDLNLATFKNRVVSLGTSTPIWSGFVARLDPTTFTQPNGEVGAFYGLKTNGIFTQEILDQLHEGYPQYQPFAKPGDVYFVDFNGDHKIDKSSDRQDLGSAIPDFTGGINLRSSWKNLDFSCFFLGSYGNKIVNGQYVYIRGSNIKSNWHADMWNRSTPDNITNIPRLDVADLNGNTSTFSDRFIEDGSYLRLKTIQIGYTIPKNLTDKVNINKLRVYVSGENLFTVTNYSGWDPEPVSYGTLNGGVDYGTYPLSRIFSFGANLTF